jgi:hypothetical protein
MARPQEQEFMNIDLDDSFDPDLEKETKLAVTPPKKLGAGVLLYDNVKYAVGLRWLVAEDDADVALAKKRAQAISADFYTLRQNVALQQGFGYLSLGHRVGMPALAASIGDVLVGEWHGVFVADNGWWYMAVHADNIAPDGDVFFLSEELAYNHFIAQSEAYLWPRSYAPESWKIQGASGEIELSKVLEEIVGSTPSLKPVTFDAIFSGKANKNIFFAVFIVVVALFFAIFAGSQFFPSLLPTRAQLPVPDVEVADDLQLPPEDFNFAAQDTASEIFAFSLVKPSIIISKCIKGFSRISIPLPGWTLDNLTCSSSSAQALWRHRVGSLKVLEPYLSRFPQNVSLSFTDSKTLLANDIILPGDADLKAPDLLEQKQIEDVLNQRFGQLGLLTTAIVKPPASEALLAAYDVMQAATFSSVGTDAPPLVAITYNDLPYVSVSLNTKTPPNMILSYFDIPGTVISGLTWQVADGSWKYEAKVILNPARRLIEANIKAKAQIKKLF